MAVSWATGERERVQEGIRRHPVDSGRCAVLARIVFGVGREHDDDTRGRQVRPPKMSAARYVVPKVPNPPRWGSHTYVETHQHAVDALTGADGCATADYLQTHWQHPDYLEVHDVDVDTVDPGLQDAP